MRDDNCIFCKIANGEIPSATVYEDDDFRAILDLGPASNGHTLILPKNHYKDLCEADETVMAKILPLAAKLGNPPKSQLGASGAVWFEQRNQCRADGISPACACDPAL